MVRDAKGAMGYWGPRGGGGPAGPRIAQSVNSLCNVQDDDGAPAEVEAKEELCSFPFLLASRICTCPKLTKPFPKTGALPRKPTTCRCYLRYLGSGVPS